MMHFDLVTTEAWLRHTSTLVPLDVFVALATLLEEILSPIPVYMVMGVAGALAASQGKSLTYVLYLALISGVMKTIGFYLFYVAGDKLENVLQRVIKKYFGLTHEAIEAVGERFTGKHWQDGGVIFLARAMPTFPSLPLSIACGVFRINLKVYLLASFLGILTKASLYVCAAYYGVSALSEYWRYLHIQSRIVGGVLLIVVIGVSLIVGYKQFQKTK